MQHFNTTFYIYDTYCDWKARDGGVVCETTFQSFFITSQVRPASTRGSSAILTFLLDGYLCFSSNILLLVVLKNLQQQQQ